jgi:hypothetical protein
VVGGEGKKKAVGEINLRWTHTLDRESKKKAPQQSLFKRRAPQQFSQRKIFVVHKTTTILKCNPQVLSHTFESGMA